MPTVAELVARIDADTSNLRRELSRADKGLTAFEKKGKKSAKGVSKSFFNVKTAIAGVTAVLGTKLIGGMVSTITQFEKLEASLKTVTGSAQAADTAFKNLQDFAATTPFQLEEVVKAFTKMKALGLDPSNEALRSYGNTASAMGMSLNQMIEAVADAATGEFERLKEFGIKASSQGDDVAFTFQGLTTTIGKNAGEIEEYLKSIGDVQFAGAMDEQANTLNVSLSNLGDEINKLVVEIGDAGLTGAMKSAVDIMKSLVTGSRELLAEFREGNLVESKKEFGELTQQITNLTLEARELQGIIAEDNEGFFFGLLGNTPENLQGELGEVIEKLQELREKRNAMREEIIAEEADTLGKQSGKGEDSPEIIEAQAIADKQKQIYDDRLKNIKKFNKAYEKVELDRTKKEAARHKKEEAEFRGLLAQEASNNKVLFNINKAARLAEAVMGAQATVANAYDYGVRISGGNPVVGVAFAATAAAAKASQISSIASASFGGGGSVSSGGGGGGVAVPTREVDEIGIPVSNSADSGNSGSSINITINSATGDVPEESIRELIARIEEAQADNVGG